MGILVLFRHGESEWNKKNIFTGWTDVGLTKKGIKDTIKAGKLLKEKGILFDIGYTSLLKRSIKSMWILLENMNQEWLQVEKVWRLNERHYGDLEWRNKKETAKKYGYDVVFKWRRGYDVRPPPMKKTDPRWEGRDPRYKGIPVPLTESLKDVVERVRPFWSNVLKPRLLKNQKILISGHGNTFRALIKIIEKLTGEQVSNLNLPMGFPLIYEFKKLKIVKKYFLGDEKEIKKIIEKVKNALK